MFVCHGRSCDQAYVDFYCFDLLKTGQGRTDQRCVIFHKSNGFLLLESLVQMSLVLTLYRSTVRQYGHKGNKSVSSNCIHTLRIGWLSDVEEFGIVLVLRRNNFKVVEIHQSKVIPPAASSVLKL